MCRFGKITHPEKWWTKHQFNGKWHKRCVWLKIQGPILSVGQTISRERAFNNFAVDFEFCCGKVALNANFVVKSLVLPQVVNTKYQLMKRKTWPEKKPIGWVRIQICHNGFWRWKEKSRFFVWFPFCRLKNVFFCDCFVEVLCSSKNVKNFHAGSHSIWICMRNLKILI